MATEISGILLWYDKNGKNAETGFLTFFDLIYKPQLKNYSANIRLQYFETDDYWLKWSQTIYNDVQSIESGLDEIPGSKKSEIRVMERVIF